MRIVFMGTPGFAVPSLEALIRLHEKNTKLEIVAVYTQPDRPAGRGQKLTASPVKQAAVSSGLKIVQPETLKTPSELRRFKDFNPDLAVVVAYGHILTREFLDAPTSGVWNVHASLLPRWRGASPIQAAILHGDSESGVTLMEMAEGLDSGGVLLTKTVQLTATTATPELHDTLARLGAQCVEEGVTRLLHNGPWKAVVQDEARVTVAKKIRKEDGVLAPTDRAEAVERKVRAFQPWPGTVAPIAGGTLKILQTSIARGVLETTPDAVNLQPGVVAMISGRVYLGFSDRPLELLTVQPEGKTAMAATDWFRGKSRDGQPLTWG